MSYSDRNGSNAARRFRNSLNLGMGVVYIIISMMVLNLKYFGTIELSSGAAYTLGGLILLYGLFRVYRGVIGLKKGND